MEMTKAGPRVTPSERYRQPKEVATERVGNELLLVHLSAGSVFRLNATGQRIWQLAVAGHSPVEIAAHLGHEIGFTTELLERDVLGLLAELTRNKLLDIRAEELG